MAISEEQVLTAVRQRNKSADTGEIFRHEVASDLGVAPDDADLARFLTRLEATGLIETLTDVDQETAPISFRYLA